MYIVEVVACRKRWKRATFLGQTAVTMYCMAYRIALSPMTLRDYEGHVPITGIFKINTIRFQLTTQKRIAESLSLRFYTHKITYEIGSFLTELLRIKLFSCCHLFFKTVYITNVAGGIVVPSVK